MTAAATHSPADLRLDPARLVADLIGFLETGTTPAETGTAAR